MITSSIIRWGILGSGKIASKFAQDMAYVPGSEVHAVASRDSERAQAFAQKHGIPLSFSSYEALCASPDVDAIYVATPHSEHFSNTLLALTSGKHVLCEKAFALNAAQAREMVSAARTHKRFLMEALWTRFLPHFQALQDVLSKDMLGTLQKLSPSGVDTHLCVQFKHEKGALSSFVSTFDAFLPTDAILYGTKGRLHMSTRFYEPTSKLLLFVGRDATPTPIAVPDVKGYGYHYEIAHANACIREERLESPLWSLTHTLNLMDTLDQVRASLVVSSTEK